VVLMGVVLALSVKAIGDDVDDAGDGEEEEKETEEDKVNEAGPTVGA
jgi:hypothetical protein